MLEIITKNERSRWFTIADVAEATKTPLGTMYYRKAQGLIPAPRTVVGDKRKYYSQAEFDRLVMLLAEQK